MKNKKLIQAGSVASLTLLAALATSTEAKANEVTPTEPTTPTATTAEPVATPQETAVPPVAAAAPVAENPAPTVAPAKEGQEVDVRVLATTDLHTNLVNYDYYQDKKDEKIGLANTAVLIDQAKKENSNVVLVDNGDTIQGTPLGTYKATVDPLENGEQHPMYKALDSLGFDAGTLGNHEFNYGLETLDKIVATSEVPLVNANVFDNQGNHRYEPFKIIDKTFTDTLGEKVALKIGITGIVPPQILNWDKSHLEGKIVVKDAIKALETVVPKVKAAGADVVVVLSHSGIGDDIYEEGEENVGYHITKIPGVDAVITGHSHAEFPKKGRNGAPNFYERYANVDGEKGLINGKPIVMAGKYGDHLGLIDLKLKHTNGSWSVVSSQGSIRQVDPADGVVNETVVSIAKEAHEGTVTYVNTPVGQTTDDINSYFALVQDDPSVQIVNNAQLWYAKKELAGTEFANLPVLSAAAPFKAGGRAYSDATNYTDIKKGGIAIKNVADLYLYDNVTAVIKLNGAQVKEWLEMSAGQFNTVDPSKKDEAQELINPDFRTYNYDVIDGVTYEIDITSKNKYDREGKLVNADANRIKNLRFNGKEVDPNQEFIVVTNNYRMNGAFPGVKDASYKDLLGLENRQAIINYILEEKTITPTADNNWKFADTVKDLNLTFKTAKNANYLLDRYTNIKYLADSDNNFGTYKLEVKETPKEVVILHTNDIHGRLEEEARNGNTSVTGLAKLDTFYKEETAKNQTTYLLDAGDAFQGLPISNATQGLDMAGIMNTIGYDAMAVGNHEFDFTLETAKKYKEVLKFPILSANTYVNDVRLFEAHTILDKDKNVKGDELVVIGVTTPETATKTHPRNVVGVSFKDPITEVNNVVKELVAKHPEHKNYVVLAHLGNDASTLEAWRGSTLAKALSENPLLKDKNVVVIDGHSHTVEKAHFGNVAYTQTGSYLNNVGKVSFKAGDLKSETSLVAAKELGKLTPNADIANLVKQAKDNFLKANSQVILENNPVEFSSARENVRVRETNLGNLISDAILDYGNNKGGFAETTDIAVFNGGGIRADILKDTKVTKADIIKVLPFGNVVSQIQVTGQTIKDMFGVALASATQKDKTTGEPVLDANGQPLLEALGGFLHISGAKVYYDTTLDAAERILKIEILNQATGAYEELDLAKTYRLATNDFLAAGGDGYKMLGGARQEGPSVDEVLAGFVKTADLNAYSVVNPNSRLISISKADFEKSQVVQTSTPQSGVLALTPEKPELVLPGTTAPTVSVKLPSDLQHLASDFNKALAKSTSTTKAVNKQALPKTSATTETNAALPAGLAAALAAAGLLSVRRRKED
ncbi:MAG: bifunctional 2',3'-cyclic-nucleotide 2'-phosphodiesterase/3'-nucleotidase [Gemella sp.]|nr:bifunctional 2',3'-cyclic-nucleotide 2'-phosphodiesterase/3'-nucleotidase [Gemella sp.]